MSKTDYAENKVVDWSTGKADPPTSIGVRWVALFTAAPSDAGGGTEVTGGSYARKSTAASDWSAASGGAAANVAAIAFVTATASWGVVTHWALMDASTAGNMVRWAALNPPRTISSGDTPSFAIGALNVSED